VRHQVAETDGAANEIGHGRHDDVWPEEKRRADEQRRLVVQQVAPPAARDDFRHDDGDQIGFTMLDELIHVIGERPKDRPER